MAAPIIFEAFTGPASLDLDLISRRTDELGFLTQAPFHFVGGHLLVEIERRVEGPWSCVRYVDGCMPWCGRCRTRRVGCVVELVIVDPIVWVVAIW